MQRDFLNIKSHTYVWICIFNWILIFKINLHKKCKHYKKSKFIPATLNVCNFSVSHTWFCSLKLSRRSSAPQWFIKASAVCLCNIMAPNLSLPQYCHNGSMCVVIYLNASDIIAGAPPPLPFYSNTHMHTRTLPPYGAHTHAGSVSIHWFNLSRNLLPERLTRYLSL